MKLDIIRAEQAQTLDGLFRERVRRTPQASAYRSYNKTTQSWYDTTWHDMALQVHRWQQALHEEGAMPGDKLALLLRNSKEWVVVDQAALGLGLVDVPLYVDDRPDNAAYILEDAQVKFLVIQDHKAWDKLAPALADNHRLKRVIILESTATPPTPAALTVTAESWLPASAPPRERHDLNPHALASIIYTSGTTGKPKGVMLSHHNMLFVADAGLQIIPVGTDDLLLSFLPLSHTLERTGGYYLSMMAGACVAYARSVAQLADDLVALQPTVLMTVPRIFERIHSRLQQQLDKQSALAKTLFNWAVAAGWAQFQYQQQLAGWHPKILLNPILKRVVGHKVMAKFGGRLRIAITGGAALPPEIARVFIGLGLPLIQGYGLTETSPVLTINTLQANNPASVGKVLPGVTLKLGENQELLAKTPGLMQGYWGNEAATRQMIDADGWIHTGDQVRIDERGFVYITGRIKDIIVLSNGEKLPPGDMEMAIMLDTLFEHALVLGEGKPYLSALLVLEAHAWKKLAQEMKLDANNPASLTDTALHKAILHRVAQQLHQFPGYAKIRRVILTLDPWTVDNGLLTPTLKLKRKPVMAKYQADIEALYAAES